MPQPLTNPNEVVTRVVRLALNQESRKTGPGAPSSDDHQVYRWDVCVGAVLVAEGLAGSRAAAVAAAREEAAAIRAVRQRATESRDVAKKKLAKERKSRPYVVQALALLLHDADTTPHLLDGAAVLEARLWERDPLRGARPGAHPTSRPAHEVAAKVLHLLDAAGYLKRLPDGRLQGAPHFIAWAKERYAAWQLDLNIPVPASLASRAAALNGALQ